MVRPLKWSLRYITYIDTGQYIEVYPDVTEIEIQVKFLFKETENCSKLLDVFSKIFSDNLPYVTMNVENGS